MRLRILSALLVGASTALAQPAPPAASSAPAPATSGAPAAPAPPAVSDPLLEPPPQAPKVISSWRDALAMVKARSIELKIALADVERAEAQGKQALAALMPSLTGTASVSQQIIRTNINNFTGETDLQLLPPRATTYEAGLGFNLPLIAPRAWYARGTAEQSKRVASLSVQEQRRLLAAGVANALVSVITAERVAELNRVALRGSLERLALTRRRAELGASNALDVLRLEQDAVASRAVVVTGDETLRQAREALGLALGQPEAYGVPPGLNLDAFTRDSERGCGKVNAVEDRTDIQVARERVELARRTRRDIDWQFYPTVDLRSNYNLSIRPIYNILGGSNGIPRQVIDTTAVPQTWSISGVLTWNIFDGGVRNALRRDTEAQVSQAEARLEQTRRTASIEVSRTLRGVEVAEQSRKIAEQTRDLAQKAERLARVSFDLGRGTSLELVDAARQLRQADVQLALREFDLVQSKIRAILAQSNCDY